MQGKKKYQEKLFTHIQLSQRIPKSNYYRRLKQNIDFYFIYKVTESLYSKSGKESLDPIVFFKLCLIRKIENLSSDRKLLSLCRIRLDLLFFLDYNLDDKLPAVSTISNIRRNIPDEMYHNICNNIEEQIRELEE